MTWKCPKCGSPASCRRPSIGDDKRIRCFFGSVLLSMFVHFDKPVNGT